MEHCKMPWGAKLHGVSGSWSFCSPLCRPRTALGACAVRDRIYAVGGQVRVFRKTPAANFAVTELQAPLLLGAASQSDLISSLRAC